ncbi:sugar phosphate isomerase/epimerase family protein [Paenibacillus lignilyticus]|uniref:Sugar phosphate isomerase/epimerase n=1 Tax=Paenibacillus lignilyticus TaxID=1172615 RepID=A0ABS5C6X9_9BACL|nr:sugar phosphate isomerase/epimerase [Paenibacillus lignilyticus]MBP3963580.1 sugar phosphate isomerase/epimerase [Paenibacillus lignilyticus]
MRLGLSSFTVTWSIGIPGYERPVEPLTHEGLIKLTRSCGLDLVQIADNLPLHPLSSDELLQLKQIADEQNVSIEVGTRGTDPALLLTYLDIARTLQSPIVRTIITTPDLAAAEQQLREVLPAFEEENIALAIENHGLHTTLQLVQLFESLNHPLVGCCLDTVNSFGALESPDVVIKRLIPYLVNLHIKDFDIKRVDHQLGFTILGAPAGAGRLDYELLRASIREHDKTSATAILELWTPFTESVEQTAARERSWMEQSIAYLKSIHFIEEKDTDYGNRNVERESV